MFFMNLYKKNKKYKPINIYYVFNNPSNFFSNVNVYTFAPYSAYNYLVSSGYPRSMKSRMFL